MSLGHIRGINSLRTVGVILVVIYHYVPKLLPGGFFGVDVFFVISGFLTTALFVKEQAENGHVRLPAFYARRVRRLMPAAAFMVIVTLTLALLISPDVRVGARSQTAAVFGWVTNYYEISIGQSYEDQFLPHLFVHTWTLGIEMQFYIIWGVLFALVFVLTKRYQWNSARARWIVVVACAVLSFAAWLHMQTLVSSAEDPSTAYYATTSRIYPLLIGSALGSLTGMHTPRRKPPAAVCMGGIVVCIAVIVWMSRTLAFSNPATYHWGILAVSALTAAILYLMLCLQQCEWFHEIRVVAEIGRRSYSIYLFHWPVFNILKQMAMSAKGPFSADTPLWIILFLSVVVSLLLAEASYRYFEHRPISAPERREHGRGVRGGMPALVAACVLMTAAAVWSLNTAPEKTLIEQDYRHQQVMLNIWQMNEYGTFLSTMQLNPVPLHGRVDLLPETPIAKAERETAEAAGLLDPKNADLREDPEGPVIPIMPPGDANIILIGDSVALGAASVVQETLGSVYVDAKESRNMGAGPDLIRQYARTGQLGEYVVIALATNVQNFTVDKTYESIEALPSGHRLIFVTPYGYDYMEETANFLRALPDQYEYVTIADWNTAVRGNTDQLAPDGLHMNSRDSKQIYANCIAQAIAQAEKKPAKP
jgi:peptidoglycan/LPS O-acetylase OafA/YrhL